MSSDAVPDDLSGWDLSPDGRIQGKMRAHMGDDAYEAMLANNQMIAESQSAFNLGLAAYRRGLGSMYTLLGVAAATLAAGIAARLLRR